MEINEMVRRCKVEIGTYEDSTEIYTSVVSMSEEVMVISPIRTHPYLSELDNETRLKMIMDDYTHSTELIRALALQKKRRNL